MLVDTDILIDSFREVPEAVDFIECHLDQIMVSSITVAELFRGSGMEGKGRPWMRSFPPSRYWISVYPLEKTVAFCEGSIGHPTIQAWRIA